MCIYIFVLIYSDEKFHGQMSLVGYRPWCCRESDRTEGLTPTLLETFMFQVIKVTVIYPPPMFISSRYILYITE